MEQFLLQVSYVIIAVCIIFFYFYKFQSKNTDDVWEEEEIELITAEDPDHTIFAESITKGPCVFTGTTVAFDKLQHYPLSELIKMEEGEKLKMNQNLQDHFLYYVKELNGPKSVISRGEAENSVNPLQKVTNKYFCIAQIKGVKKILLFTPRQEKNLYPSPTNPTVSQANYFKDPLINYPTLQDTTYIEIEAYPGHLISIPKGYWWTSITLEESFNSYLRVD
jgi:hypothetical protein